MSHRAQHEKDDHMPINIRIVAELMSNARVEDVHLRFAISHAAEMLVSLEKEYDARWYGERPQQS
jgi:hypothetical protein